MLKTLIKIFFLKKLKYGEAITFNQLLMFFTSKSKTISCENALKDAFKFFDRFEY